MKCPPASPKAGAALRNDKHQHGANEPSIILSYKPKSPGNQSDICGMYVMSIKTANMASIKGIRGFITSVTLTLATPLPTKSKVPTGGVHTPIQRFSTNTIPKWTGSIPSAVTTGRKIGVNINTAGDMSMNVPITNRVRLMIRKITIGLLKFSSIKPVII